MIHSPSGFSKSSRFSAAFPVPSTTCSACGARELFLRERKADGSVRPTQALPPVSILKPLKGTDPDIYESFRSHCLQDYPEYEIIFGVSDPDDPAVASVQQLQREFPERAIRLVVSPNKLGANVKVSNLEQMLPSARYPAPDRQRQRHSRRARLSSPGHGAADG